MKLIRRLSGLGLVIACGALLIGLLFAGCATTEEPKFSSGPAEAGSPGGTPRTERESDRFAIGELVIVNFSGSPDTTMQPHEERIKDDGTITLPLIGAVKAAGTSPGDLQTEIRDLYVPKYYVRLTVTVKSQERVYFVGGEVRMPNRYPYIGGTTVIKAIQTAGDFNDYANKSKVRLTRSDGKIITVNCKKAIGDARLDPPVFPGDRIDVPRRLW